MKGQGNHDDLPASFTIVQSSLIVIFSLLNSSMLSKEEGFFCKDCLRSWVSYLTQSQVRTQRKVNDQSDSDGNHQHVEHNNKYSNPFPPNSQWPTGTYMIIEVPWITPIGFQQQQTKEPLLKP